jgi:hypothetical protein
MIPIILTVLRRRAVLESDLIWARPLVPWVLLLNSPEASVESIHLTISLSACDGNRKGMSFGQSSFI